MVTKELVTSYLRCMLDMSISSNRYGIHVELLTEMGAIRGAETRPIGNFLLVTQSREALRVICGRIVWRPASRSLPKGQTSRRPLGCQFNSLPDRLEQAPFIGLPCPGNVEGRPVINRCSYYGQPDGDVHTQFKAEDLHRTVALIVIHGNDQIEVAALRAIEQRVGRQGSLHIPSSPAARIQSRHNLLLFLAMPEEPILSRMGINATYSDARIANSGLLQCIVSTCDGPFHKTGLDARDGIDEPNVRRHMQHFHLRRAQHHRYFRRTRQMGEQFGVTWKPMPSHLQGLLVQRSRAYRRNFALHRESCRDL